MDKVDLKKEWKPYYGPSAKTIGFVDVPTFSFLSIEGIDARPDSPDFTGAIQALFSLSYKVKFASKKQLGRDYAVMPLEALWWADDMDEFVNGNKEKWRWKLLIQQPEWIDGDFIDSVRSGLKDADWEGGHLDRVVVDFHSGSGFPAGDRLSGRKKRERERPLVERQRLSVDSAPQGSRLAAVQKETKPPLALVDPRQVPIHRVELALANVERRISRRVEE